MIHTVTIKEKIQLYKGEEPANAIELLTLEEFGFELISAKDRFNVGDKALLVEPDYNLPDTEFWKDWTMPNGDPKKSKLGSNNRIRAVKFNLHRGDGMPVYSNGILLTFEEAEKFIEEFNTRPKEAGIATKRLYVTDLPYLAATLGIYKYQAPERNQGGTGKAGASREFPKGLYKTDEVRFEKVSWTFPLELVGMEKADGSSITLFSHLKESGICSRNLLKPLTYKKKVGFKNGFWFKLLSLFGYDRNIYKEVESESEFVTIGKPYLEKLEEYCKVNNFTVALRGELVGKGASNGSGNKNNPHVNLEPQILFFGADWYDGNTCQRTTFSSFMSLVHELGFNTPEIVFTKIFNSKEELLETCNNYFKDHLIEGIVVRSLNGKLSAKVMSAEYDSRK